MSDGKRTMPVYCRGCNAVLGRMVMVDGAIYLDTGSWLMLAGKRYCHSCGSAFHYRPPKKSWDELWARHIQDVPVLEEP